jgi:hypothetical protein
MTAHDHGINDALRRAAEPPTDDELAAHLSRTDAASKPVWFDPAHYARLAETPAPMADIRDRLDNDRPLPTGAAIVAVVALAVIGAVGLWLAGVW